MKAAAIFFLVILGFSVHAEDHRFVWFQGGADAVYCGDLKTGYIVDDAYCSLPKVSAESLYQGQYKADVKRAEDVGCCGFANDFKERLPLIDDGNRTFTIRDVLEQDASWNPWPTDLEKLVRKEAAKRHLQLSLSKFGDSLATFFQLELTGSQSALLEMDAILAPYRIKD